VEFKFIGDHSSILRTIITPSRRPHKNDINVPKIGKNCQTLHGENVIEAQRPLQPSAKIKSNTNKQGGYKSRFFK